jgi:fatty-acyl-CoA synthase
MINPAYQPLQLLHSLNEVEANALVCAEDCGSGSCYEMVLQLIPELASYSEGDIHSEQVPTLRMLIVMGGRKFP